MKMYGRCLLATALGLGISLSYAQTSYIPCGSLENGYGPFDYRSTDPAKKTLVEKHHFTPKVEFLKGGSTAMTPGGDLAYTLRAFPNHPRALLATSRFAERTKRNPPPEMEYSVECWFERAERFAPDDVTVKMLHGTHLIRTGKTQQGIPKLEEALELAEDDTNTLYNLGLAYFEIGNHEKSLELAHRAYAQGFPLPGLREKLKRAGKWKEPVQGVQKQMSQIQELKPEKSSNQ